MSYGVHQYRRSEGSALSPRETEAAAFSFVNRMLTQESDADMRMLGLIKNQQLWSLLLKDIGSSGNGLPSILKSDVAKLGLWVMRHTISAMGNRQLPVAPLVGVNSDMISALQTRSQHGSDTKPAQSLAVAG